MNKRTKIVILDYGVGNLYSLARAVSNFTSDYLVTDDAETIASADKLIMPGVGSFEAGMSGIRVRGLEKAIKQFAQSGRSILGICLGAQILMSQGREFGKFKGLDIIPGEVVKFPALKTGKVPHIGWNQLALKPISTETTLFTNTTPEPYFYFVHSYIMKPESSQHIIATTEYGGCEFCSVVQAGRVHGVQFHPEKSGAAGMRLIRNFINQT